MHESLSYEKAGVNIDVADATKKQMAKSLETDDQRVLNRIGAFASLFDGRFPGYRHPVLVLKTEEPGSKQKLAFEHGRVESICYDMINHLINDIAVMGATPLSVQDAIICGKLDQQVVGRMVRAMSDACREQGCHLTGGETSEQPGVVEPGIYILTSSVVGVVDKSKIIDGSKIREGDKVISIASNGLHTNGYSLVRALIAANPDILSVMVDGQSFLDAILTPHKCYYQALKGLFDHPRLHGLAHITGGGIQDNLNRILPDSLDASVDLETIDIPTVFKIIRDAGNVDDKDMMRTFNMGVGLTAVVDPDAVGAIVDHLATHDCQAKEIGRIVPGSKKATFTGCLNW